MKKHFVPAFLACCSIAVAHAEEGNFRITVPAEASLYIAQKPGNNKTHFVDFEWLTATSCTTESGTKTFTYDLVEGQQYNYRVSIEGGLTQAGVFTMQADGMTSMTFTADDFATESPSYINRDVTANGGYNIADIYVNINEQGHLRLNKGDVYDAIAYRSWEVVNTTTANYFVEPDYHYTVLDLDGRPVSNVISVEQSYGSQWARLRAVGEGTVIVLVSYDAFKTHAYDAKGQRGDMAGGSLWSAIWPENTAVYVVSVGQDSADIISGMTINEGANLTGLKQSGDAVDAEFDVFYYLADTDGYAYTFTPSGAKHVDIARPTIGDGGVSYSGFSTEGVTRNADGSYTVLLREGRQIVRLTDAAGNAAYQVLTAKGVGYTLSNPAKPEAADFAAGDTVAVKFNTLYHPAAKMAGIHNFSAAISYAQLPEGMSMNKPTANQYQFAATEAAQTATFTLPADWDGQSALTISGGAIQLGGWGDVLGNHRLTKPDEGRQPNFAADVQTSLLCALPDIVIPAAAPAEPEEEPVVVPAEHDTVDFEGDYFAALIDNPQYMGPQLYGDGSYNWTDATTTLSSELTDLYGDGMFWGGGVAISNYIEPDIAACDYTTQLAVPASNGSSQFAIATGDYSYIYFNDGQPRPVYTMDIAPTSYLLNVEKNGNWGGGALEGDPSAWFKVTIANAEDDDNAVDVFLCRDGRVQQGWRTVDLSQLGEVTMLQFTFSGSDTGDWGLNTPAYFAFDNVTVGRVIPVGNRAATTSPPAQSSSYDLSGRRAAVSNNGVRIEDGKLVVRGW